jgi:hypothetical protein
VNQYFQDDVILCENFQICAIFLTIWAVFQPLVGISFVFRRYDSCAPISLQSTIHKFDSAYSVTSWSVFFFKPG